MWRRSMTGALAALLSAGCASAPFPDDTLRGVDRALTLNALRASPAAHRGARVILGGQIIATMPKPGATEIDVLSRRLRDGGAPEGGDRSDGRFLVRTAKFLDPAIYAPGRRLTGGVELPQGGLELGSVWRHRRHRRDKARTVGRQRQARDPGQGQEHVEIEGSHDGRP